MEPFKPWPVFGHPVERKKGHGIAGNGGHVGEICRRAVRPLSDVAIYAHVRNWISLSKDSNLLMDIE
jgi:hypothetical protein